ncbi:MAG: ImmA/IrrE family metallo-endopeptidase [Dehalococcoidia bacterium]|nr:ImmA/IrrE family metallo-endopeptidase [Dehalococcoidia bacterium]
MTQPIPVNPAILRWARETAGLSIEEVVRKLNRKSIAAETVAAWEAVSASASPNYLQLETLAYTIYKRPMALFFFPEPPVEETPQQAFRTLPEQEIQRMSPRLRYLLRQAKSMQLNLYELYDYINPAQKQIVRDLKFAPNVSISKMVTTIRKYLNVELNVQVQWKSAEVAFKAWRNALEECGVFVFKEAFKNDAFSGFCLYDDRFPLIYVNNSKPDTRQIFTLFHELPHLLLGTGGVDTPLENYIDFLQGDDKQIEILCNRFAGAFLVPDEDFERRIETVAINDDTAEDLANRYANRYSVSREVILRKFYDRKLVSPQFYEQKVEQWRKEKGKSGEGGNYYLNKGVYLGERYIDLVFSRLYQNRISIEELSDYLGVKVKSVPGMEALLFRKGTTA